MKPLPAILFAALLLGTSAPAAASDGNTVWELTPYLVRVYLHVERGADLTPALQHDILEHLVDRTDLVIGSAWRVEATAAPTELARVLRGGLEKLRPEDLPEGWRQFDKVLCVRVSRTPAAAEIAAREFDVRTQTPGAIHRRRVAQRELLPEEVFRALCEAFAPLARVESVDSKNVELRLRAGALAPRDATLAFVASDTVFRPIIRFNYSDGTLKQVRTLPWTFLTVDKVEGPVVHGTLHSGLRSPLSSRRRGRVEQLALPARAELTGTRLELYSRTEKDLPLAGYEVHAHALGSKTTTLLGSTDMQGAIAIGPPEPGEPPLRLLVIKHGGEFLARLPILPGLEATNRAEIANDDHRLAVEGFITGVQEELIDTLAQRDVLLRRIQNRLDAGKIDEARALVADLRRLPTREQFRERLATFERTIFTNDPETRRKIDRLFADTRKVLDKYLDPKPLEEIAAKVPSS